MGTMIRKQLYITEDQNARLKRRARELGLSEAKLARRALDELLRDEGDAEQPRAATESAREQALEELLASTRRLAKGRRLSENFRKEYQERGRALLYDERMSR